MWNVENSHVYSLTTDIQFKEITADKTVDTFYEKKKWTEIHQ